MDFRVDVAIRTSGKDKIDSLEKQIRQLKNSSVKLNFTTDATSEIAKLKRQITELQAQRIRVRTDTSNAKSDFQILKNLANEISQKQIKIAGLDTSKNSNQIVTLTSQLKKLQSDYKVLYSTLGKNLNTSQIGQLENIFGKTTDRVNELNAKAKDLVSTMSKATKPFNSLDAMTASNKTLAWLNNNTKAAKDYGEALTQLAAKQKAATNSAELTQYNKEFRNIVSQAQLAGKTGKSFVDDFKRAFGQIFQFAGAYGLIQNVAFQVPQQMWSAVRDVDDAMTSLQMATGVSNDQAKELMSTYAQLGDQLKATSTDVAASATEYLKQGQSIADSNKLAQSSIVLSKIGDLTSEEATSTITAAMKSYDIGVDGVMDFVDKISAIDMASATDVGGLATAFNEVAANARNAGIEVDKVLSYAAVIGETTQESMASVGTSLNAIFSRMGNIKLSRLKDPETGEDLSNTETSLRNVGIELRETTGEFRDFDEVLDEVADNWNSYSEVEQRSIASSLAGTNHMNEILVLMQNYDQVGKLMTEAADSAGTSMQKYEAYTDSLAGKIEGFTNAFQTMSTTFLNSDLFGGLIDGATGFLNILTQILDVGGGLPAVLGTFLTVLGAKGHGKRKVIVYNALHYKVA